MTHITFFIQDGNSTWTRSSYNRSHTHDIRALALVEGDKGNKSASLLISGGISLHKKLLGGLQKIAARARIRIKKFKMWVIEEITSTTMQCLKHEQQCFIKFKNLRV